MSPKQKPKQPATLPKTQPKPRGRFWHSLTEHEQLLLSGLAVLIVGGFAAWQYVFSTVELVTTGQGNAAIAAEAESVASPTPATFSRRLDGLSVTTAREANPWPIGIMIENLVAVRPQSGLAGAAVVYETLAESGVTRFLALYNGAGPDLQKIGPVRSARHYYVDWVLETDALYAHAGGSPQALSAIAGFAVKDLNGIGRAARFFWRDRSIGAPHNLFTKSELLRLALRDSGVETREAAFDSWTFQDDAPLDDRGIDDTKAVVSFSSKSYEVEWRFRRADNTYVRFNGGMPHTDRETGQELSAKNVVIQRVKPVVSLGEKGRIDLATTGEGSVTILRDGKVFSRTWKKPDRSSRTLFTDSEGKPLPLVRGNTWVEVVPENQNVTLPQ